MTDSTPFFYARTYAKEPKPEYYWRFMGMPISPNFDTLKDVRDWWKDNTPKEIGIYQLIKQAGDYPAIVWATQFVETETAPIKMPKRVKVR